MLNLFNNHIKYKLISYSGDKLPYNSAIMWKIFVSVTYAQE